MAIKKRATLPQENEDLETVGLNIVAQPKKPIPEGGVLRSLYGNTSDPVNNRRVGNVVLALSDEESYVDTFTKEDYVSLIRTPFDVNNQQERRYRNRVKNRGTAITAMCIVCVGGRKAVTECASTTCPLWAFRFGSDPFYGKRG